MQRTYRLLIPGDITLTHISLLGCELMLSLQLICHPSLHVSVATPSDQYSPVWPLHLVNKKLVPHLSFFHDTGILSIPQMELFWSHQHKHVT